MLSYDLLNLNFKENTYVISKGWNVNPQKVMNESLFEWIFLKKFILHVYCSKITTPFHFYANFLTQINPSDSTSSFILSPVLNYKFTLISSFVHIVSSCYFKLKIINVEWNYKCRKSQDHFLLIKAWKKYFKLYFLNGNALALYADQINWEN